VALREIRAEEERASPVDTAATGSGPTDTPS
jgi:hypothetical protein